MAEVTGEDYETADEILSMLIGWDGRTHKELFARIIAGTLADARADAEGPEVIGVVYGHFDDLQGGMLVQLEPADLPRFSRCDVRGLERVVMVDWDCGDWASMVGGGDG